MSRKRKGSYGNTKYTPDLTIDLGLSIRTLAFVQGPSDAPSRGSSLCDRCAVRAESSPSGTRSLVARFDRAQNCLSMSRQSAGQPTLCHYP